MACQQSKWTSIAILLAICASHTVDAFVNSKIDRIIDLSSQLVKITERITIEGDPGLYIIKIAPSHRERLAYIDATLNGQPIDLVAKTDGSYEANLAEKSLKQPLIVTSVYTKLLKPYPAEIKQSDRQLVKYEGLQSTLSPYLTKTITTRIKLPQSSRLESFTKASKMTTGSNKITYGPFKDVEPDQAEPLTIHYENNTPFVAVTHLLRTVEVSPWSRSISVVNDVKVAHVGAKLKGPFSRFEYQRDHSNGVSSVRNFIVDLPKTSRDIYFRDGIGNISTSNVRTTSTKTIVNIKPRFPLFGGWVTDFHLGYKVPIGDFINEPISGNNFRFSLPFADSMYENMFIEDSTVRIVLPAGATNIEVKGAISFDRLIDDTSYSYLDLIGRPVVTLNKRNIVAQHLDGKPLVIRYNYTKMYMLQEPILLLAAAIGALITAAIYSKMSSRSITYNTGKQKSD